MAQRFGLTWWGEQWLNSLKSIDFQNRLPRGASYARKGMVSSLKIKENVIDAEVQGSRPNPYKVRIIIPEFTESERKSLMEEILKHPTIISKLLNRELTPDVVKITDKLGLKLFPRKWTDFDMHCSCPDWAVPCKHLAAVIYTISQEIDNNPFLIFTLHGLDIINELSTNYGIILNEKGILNPPHLYSFINKYDRYKKNIIYDFPPFEKADFSLIPTLTNTLLRLLEPRPTFYRQGNFRDVYQSEIQRVAKHAGRIIAHKTSLCERESKITILHRNAFNLQLDDKAQIQCTDEENHLIDIYEWIIALMSIPVNMLPDYHPTTQIFHQAVTLSMHLISHGAIVPQIIQLKNDEFFIRWLPAVIDAQIQSQMALMSRIMPDNMLIFNDGKRKSYLLNESEWLISSFTGVLLDMLCSDISGSLISFFFRNCSYNFDTIGEKEIPGSILQWIQRFYIQNSRFTPVFKIDETDIIGLFDMSVEIMDNESAEIQSIALHHVMTDEASLPIRFEVLRMLSNISAFVKGLEKHLNDNGIGKMQLDGEDVITFLLNTLPIMQIMNVKVILPKSLKEIVRPRLSMRVKTSSNNIKGKIHIGDLLSFDWQMALGDRQISPADFYELIKTAKGLIYFKGQYIYVTEEDILRIQKMLTESNKISVSTLLQAAITEEWNNTPVTLTQEARDLLKELTEQDEIAVPSTLQATLRPYQCRGYSWLYRNMRLGFGSILADDMGLGKTIQAITLLLKIQEEQMFTGKKSLIITPKGLLPNWQAELERFAPSLSVALYYGATRVLPDKDIDVILTSYGTARSDIEILKKEKWLAVIIDEAQNIKNDKTAQSKAIKTLSAHTHIALSGTPVENRLSEYWSIMDFANRGYLGSVSNFNKEFTTPIQETGDQQVASRFRKITAPFMMRRLKTDKNIISDLPDKIEQNEYAFLTPKQASVYEETVQSAMKAIEGIEGIDNQSLFKRQGLILQMILALKQICNHPSQFLKDISDDAYASGKMELLFDLLDGIIDSRQKVLIFTQFRKMGEMLQHFIEKARGEKPLFYHGGCSLKERQEMITRFQTNPTDNIFILSLKAAGTGLNLTAASHVIHYDLWWNPAVESQATDRAYRIGQKNNVIVHRFITKNTFEEKIDLLIQQKKHLADMTVAAGENWIGKLTNKELHEIFDR